MAFAISLSGAVYAVEVACCPAPGPGQSVINADQTVIIVWDPVTKIEHFIRQASFKTEAPDFGFLIPTPSQPELDESGNDTFPFLATITAPEVETRNYYVQPIGCGSLRDTKTATAMMTPKPVNVLEEKLVAGFNAVVLEASSAKALAAWLTEKGYVLSPEIEAWAKPYVDAGWKITALKVAPKSAKSDDKTVEASALRLSFKTDRPLFPYREPDYRNAATKLNASYRVLRIYFIGDTRYKGDLSPETPWTGKAVWSNKLDSASRQTALKLLKLPESSGPAQWWLTEFEDVWPYKVAPADLYFSPDANQSVLKRPPIIQYVYVQGPMEFTCIGIPILLIAAVIWRIRARYAAKRN